MFNKESDFWSWSRKSVKERLMKMLVYVLLSIGAIFFLFPFLWILSTSLKPSNQVLLWPPKWIPEPICGGIIWMPGNLHPRDFS